MSLATPRILPCHLHAFAPSSSQITTVRILGTITSLHGDQATLESCNGETVTLILARDSHLSLSSHTYEVIGKVINLEGGLGLGLRVLGSTEWKVGESSAAASAAAGGTMGVTGVGSLGTGPGPGVIDMAAYEAVVDATHRFRGLFYDDGGAGAGAGAGAGVGGEGMVMY